MKPKEYVLGFAFSRDKNTLALIEKQKPAWQKDKHNGIGGKLEDYDKSTIDAMVREFKEETGVETNVDMWQPFAKMVFKEDVLGGEAWVWCFRIFSNAVYQVKTVELEKIKLLALNENSTYPKIHDVIIIKNLNVLIPMALDEDFNDCILNVL